MSISAGQQREIQRAVHLATAVVLFTYVYLPLGQVLAGAVRWIAVPILATTGLLMWQSARVRRMARRVSRLRVRPLDTAA